MSEVRTIHHRPYTVRSHYSDENSDCPICALEDEVERLKKQSEYDTSLVRDAAESIQLSEKAREKAEASLADMAEKMESYLGTVTQERERAEKAEVRVMELEEHLREHEPECSLCPVILNAPGGRETDREAER